MTNEELVELIQQGINVTDNMYLLYEQNKKFIKKVVNRLSGYTDIEDLMQEAYFGLDRAAKCFDPTKGVKFLTYLPYWIKQVTKRYVDNCRKAVRIPIHEIERMSKYHKAVNDYIKETGEKPSAGYLCHKLNTSYKGIKHLEGIIHMYSSVSSLNEALNENDDTEIGDLIPGMSDTELEALQGITDNDVWEEAKKELTDEEYYVVWLRFKENRTRDAIAILLDTKGSVIREIEKKALRKLSFPLVKKSFS